jgi:hypothetical protein
LLNRKDGAAVRGALYGFEDQIDSFANKILRALRFAKLWHFKVTMCNRPPGKTLTGLRAKETPNVEVLHSVLAIYVMQRSTLT